LVTFSTHPKAFQPPIITTKLAMDSGFMMLTRTCPLMVMPLQTSTLVVLLYGPTRP